MYSEWKKISSEEHDAFIKTQPLCNLLQSSAWASVKDTWDHECIGLYEDDHLVASSMILIQRLPLHLSMIYMPRGPVLDYENRTLLVHAMEALKRYAKKMHCFSITLDPAIVRRVYTKTEVVENFDDSNQRLIELLATCGVKHLGYTMEIAATIQPRFHAGVKTLEHFEDSFPKHTKRHIKKATKNGIVIEHGSYDLLDDFASLMRKTEERKNIYLRDNEYFKKILDAYGEDAGICIAYLDVKGSLQQVQEELKVQEQKINKNEECLKQIEKLNAKDCELRALLAEAGEKIPCAAALYASFHKTCEMLYMGMDYHYHHYMPAFISHVEAMRWSNAHGCDFCNMGGIEPNMDGGLYKFKDNFAPIIYEYIGEFECPIQKITYRLFKIANALRIKLRDRKTTH